MNLGENATERRLAELEEELASLRARVDRMEANATRLPASPAAPADVDDEIVLDPEKAEYLIGAQLLPRLGAALIVLAVILLAVLGSANGSGANALPILAGQLIACLGFIAVGEWKRNELEGFGQVLTAIGSFGLFLSAASAHFAYGVITAEALSAACLGLALLNLLYSWWRNSKAFHVLGLLGGLAGAIFPLSQHNFVLSCCAYTITGIAAGWVTMDRRWPGMAVTQWILTLIAFVPLVASDQAWVYLVPAFYAASLAPIAAYARCLPSSAIKTWAIPAPIALFVTGLIGWGMQHSYPGALPILILAMAGVGASSTLPAGSRDRTSLLIGALATGAILIPWCFPTLAATVLFSFLAVLSWPLRRFIAPSLAAVFAVIELGMAAWAYSYVGGSSFGTDNLLLVCLAAGVAFAGLAARAAHWNGLVVAAIGGWVLIARWAQVLFTHFRPDMGGFSASTLASIAYALLLLSFGFGMRSASLRFCSFGVMFVTIGKILIVDLSSTAVVFRVGVLLALGLLMLAGGYAYVRGKATPRLSS